MRADRRWCDMDGAKGPPSSRASTGPPRRCTPKWRPHGTSQRTRKRTTSCDSRPISPHAWGRSKNWGSRIFPPPADDAGEGARTHRACDVRSQHGPHRRQRVPPGAAGRPWEVHRKSTASATVQPLFREVRFCLSPTRRRRRRPHDWPASPLRFPAPDVGHGCQQRVPGQAHPRPPGNRESALAPRSKLPGSRVPGPARRSPWSSASDGPCPTAFRCPLRLLAQQPEPPATGNGEIYAGALVVGHH